MKGTSIIVVSVLQRCNLSNRHPKVFVSPSVLDHKVYEFYAQFHRPILAFTRPLKTQLDGERDI
jgi:hypothetical protein